MPRIVTVGAAQLGPIARTESRSHAVARLIALMRQAASHGCDLVVFPECALTAFFPHWYWATTRRYTIPHRRSTTISRNFTTRS